MRTAVGIVFVAVMAVAVLCATQSSNSPAPVSPTPYLNDTAYEVYRAILAQPCDKTSAGINWENWGCDVENARPLLIRRDTVSPYSEGSCAKLNSSADSAIRLAIANWKEMNTKTWLLEYKLDLPIPYDMISADELRNIFERPGRQRPWDLFTEKHPNAGGWVEVSAIGFNPEKDVAVVYVGHHCGGLCGRGFVQVLRKKNGAWSAVKSAISGCGWMS